MSIISDFASQHVGFLVFAVLVILSTAASNYRPGQSRLNLMGSSIGGGLTLAVVLLGLWTVASNPTILAEFFKSEFIQAISAVATAGATIALWIVTGRLTRVTRVQVHSVTAPLIIAQIYVRNDPEPNREIQDALFLPFYEFVNEDSAEPEINAYHVEHARSYEEFERAHGEWNERRERGEYLSGEARHNFDLGPEPIAPAKTFIVVRIYNVQAVSAYGLAADIEIDVVCTFPRYSFARGATSSTVVTPAQMFEQPRTLKVQFLAGQGSYAIAAFRVDQVPIWNFRIDTIRHKDARGKSGTYAAGSKFASFGPDGLTIQSGEFPPMKGEQPT